MILIKLLFMTTFVIGVLFLIEPILGRLTVGFLVLRRNRFYDKRRNDGRIGADDKKGFLDRSLIKKLDKYMSIAEVKVPSKYLLALCVLITVLVLVLTNRLMPAPLYNMIIGVLFGSMPLLWVWSRYQKKTLAMASVMIPTVQNFIGYFTEAENLESAIFKADRTIPVEISNEWNRLIMDLQTGEKPEKAILQFADRVGNEWAHYFADILITHVDTGVNITSSLFKLIGEMQNSEYNEEKRITLLTAYKYGTFIMILLSVVIVIFNIKMDPKNYQYYFHTASGVHIVTLSIIVLFGSFISAIHMGRKRL